MEVPNLFLLRDQINSGKYLDPIEVEVLIDAYVHVCQEFMELSEKHNRLKEYVEDDGA